MSATEDLYRSYLDLRWNFDPAAATAAGVTSEDHRLGSFDADSMRAHLAAFRSMAGAVEALEVQDLQEEIDRTAFLDEIRVTVSRFEKEKPQVHNPCFWLSHLFRSIHGLLKRPQSDGLDRAQAVLDRLQGAEGFLSAARESLKDPPRVFIDTAVSMAEAGNRLFADAAERVSSEAPDLAEGLEAAGESAERELGRFLFALKTELHAHPDDLSFAIGEDQFNRRLHHEHALMAGAPELYRYGLHLVDEVEAEIAVLARELDPGVPWRRLVERLRSEAPAPQDLVSAFRLAMERARSFVESRALVTLPTGPLEVVEAPSFLQPLIPFAAYEPPGPFAADRTGYFYVTADHAAGRHDHGSSLHELPATALHEGYPGHHVQILSAQQCSSAVRRVSWTPVTVEGWALYCEEMMAAEGFYATPEERLFQRLHLLWRAARIVLDIGLHTRGMTPDQAADYLVDRLGLDRDKAQAEVSRYCARPTYQLSYAIGRREILHLRDAYRDRAGAEFSLRRFHDEFLSYGGLPVTLIRWGMGLGIDE